MARKKKEEWVYCRCLRPGQVRLRNGHIRMLWGGEERILLNKTAGLPDHVEEMTEKTDRARLPDGSLDFEKATKEQIDKTDFPLEDLIKFIQERYDPEFDLHPDIGKPKLVEALLGYRMDDLE